MAIQQITTIYEVLVRFDDEGQFRGAHISDLTRLVDADTGSVMAANTLTRPVSASELDTVLANSAGLVEQIATLTADLAAANAAKAAAETARDEALARVAALEAQIAPVDANGFRVLSAVQVRLGLIAGGIMPSQVDAMIAAMPAGAEREAAEAHWHYATSYHRDHPLVAQIATAMGLTTEQVDAMWRAAPT